MKTKPRSLEKPIENSILEFLSHLPGCYAWKNQSVGIYDPKKKLFRKSMNKYAINGVADILGLYGGRMLAIEVKSPDNKNRPPDQVRFLENIKSFGGIAFFATSINDVIVGMGITEIIKERSKKGVLQ